MTNLERRQKAIEEQVSPTALCLFINMFEAGARIQFRSASLLDECYEDFSGEGVWQPFWQDVGEDHPWSVWCVQYRSIPHKATGYAVCDKNGALLRVGTELSDADPEGARVVEMTEVEKD